MENEGRVSQMPKRKERHGRVPRREGCGTQIFPGADNHVILRTMRLGDYGCCYISFTSVSDADSYLILMACIRANKFSFQQLFFECLICVKYHGSKDKETWDPGP